MATTITMPTTIEATILEAATIITITMLITPTTIEAITRKTTITIM